MRSDRNSIKQRHSDLIAEQIADFQKSGNEVYQAIHGETAYKTMFSFGERAKADWRTRNEQAKAAQ